MKRLQSHPPFRRALTAIAVLAAPAVAGALIVGTAAGPAAAGSGVTVSVNAGQSLAVVPSTAIGINGSTYDGNLTDAAVPGLLAGAGTDVVRFPGGTESDEYDWKNNTDVLSGKTQAVDFDQYASMLAASGAQGMVTVDYGTGDEAGAAQSPAESGAQLAADWVRYANVEHDYDIKYWEIGNEVYGNGTYGADWEPDQHCASGSDPSNCGPAVYAANVKTYINAMKAVDPSISIGVVLTAPGNWPDGVTSAGSPESWNQTVMTALAGQIGFADVHWYPQNPGDETDAGLLGDTAQIPAMVATLRTELGEYAGQQNAPIDITETNSVSSNPGKQTVGIVNALYLEQDYLGWLSDGVSNVDWWQIHNGIVTGGDNASSLYGSADYGDYGVLSNGSCGALGSSQICEPAADTAAPAYYGLKLLGQFIHSGDTIVSASSSQSLVQAYAVKAQNGSLRVMLVNDDPANSYTVNLGYSGFNPSNAAPSVSTLAEPGSGITSATSGTATSQTITPYSVTVLTLAAGSASTGPSATPTTTGPSASASPSTSGPTGSPTGSPSASASASASATATSGPTGGTNGCAASWSLTNSWSGGFQLGFTVTDTGRSATNGWSVGFSWPGSQTVTQIWNAASSQSGSAVDVTSLSYDGVIQPAASTTFGLLGSGTAPTSLPNLVCTAG